MMKKLVIAIFILLVGFSYFVTANHLTGDAQKNQIISWNNKLISYSNIAKLRPLTAVELSDATSISQQRKIEMLDLMKKESSTFFEVTLAKSVRDNLPLQVKNNIEEQFDKQGTILVSIVDYEDGHEEKIYQFDDSTTTSTLFFSNTITKPKSSGDVVSLSGYKLDDNVIAKQLTILKGGGAAIGTYPFSTGKQKIAIILFSYKNRPYNFPLSFDPYFISEQDFSRVPFQVEEFYSKQSGGWMDIDFAIFRYTIDKDLVPTVDDKGIECVSAYDLLDEVRSQKQAGVLNIPVEYNTFVGFFPVEWCGPVGIAYLGPVDKGNIMYAAVESRYDLTSSITAHELGHTRGLDHVEDGDCRECVMYPYIGKNRIDGGAYFTDEEKKKLGWIGSPPDFPSEPFYIYNTKVSHIVSSVTLAPGARINWETNLFGDSRAECKEYATTEFNIFSYNIKQTNNHVVEILGPVIDGKISPLKANSAYYCKLESINKQSGFDLAAIQTYSFVFRPGGENTALALLGFMRGDVNSDYKVDLSDSISILSYLYQGGPRPACLDSADTNDDGIVDLSDTVYLLAHLFRGGPAPPRPYPYYDIDTTPDALIC